MAIVNGTEFEFVDLQQNSGGNTTRHMLRDAKAREDISSLKSALGTGFLNTTDSSGDANDLGPGVTRVTAEAAHIPMASVGYVITFARTETTAKSQIYINAPTGTYTGRCHLFARYLVNGTWSNWIDFASYTEVAAAAVNAYNLIASVEATNTASVAHAAGSYFILNNTLYRATTNIAVGVTIASGTNCTSVKLCNDVTTLNANITAILAALGTGFLNTTDSSGDANNFGAGVTRVTAEASHIPIAQIGYVVTFARTATTAKAQIFINAPVTTYTGRCHLYARYLVSGTWSNWVDFASIDEVEAIPEQVWTNGTDYNGDLNSSPVGVSRVLGTATNNPAGEIGYVITISRAASAKAQIFITNNALYFRTSASGTWSAWNSTLKASTDRAVGYTFGDSLMAQDGNAFAYPSPQYNADEIGKTCVGWQTLLHNEFGVTMTNYAVGGQGIAGQKPVIKSKTYTGIDFVIISVGVNDYSNAVQLGQMPASRNATFTNGLFIDDLCESIEYILSENPQIKILLFTPCQRDTTWRNDGTPDFSKSATDVYTQNSRGLYLKDYADAIKDIGKMYSCVVCDMYAESGLNYLTLPEFTFEGVHPTNEGYLFTSRALFEAFKKL